MRAVFRILLLLTLLPLIGAAWFMLIEGWSWIDSLYMAVTTITTVGFGEVHPLGTRARLFVMAYLVFGLGAFTYSLARLGEQAYRATVRDWLARRKMDTAIHAMRNHFIVCGFGRMGRAICRRLADMGVPFVVVDKAADALDEARERGWSWLTGDASDDETLKTAGIARARGLAAVLGLDADNVYLTLSARLLAPGLAVVARASDEQSVPKLMKAGASRVVGLHDTGAARMAQLLVNPNLERLAKVFEAKGLELDVAEVDVPTGAADVGKTLAETNYRRRGVEIVAIRRAGGEVVLPTTAATRIEANDLLIAVGKMEAIAGFVKPG